MFAKKLLFIYFFYLSLLINFSAYAEEFKSEPSDTLQEVTLDSTDNSFPVKEVIDESVKKRTAQEEAREKTLESLLANTEEEVAKEESSSQALDMLLDTTLEEIKKTEKEVFDFQKMLPHKLNQFNNKSTEYSTLIETYKAALQLSKNRPLELTIVEKNTINTHKDLQNFLLPEQKRLQSIETHYKAIEDFINNVTSIESIAITSKRTELEDIQESFKKEILLFSKAVVNIQTLNSKYIAFIEQLEKDKLSLWWEYYFTPSSSVFHAEAWNTFINEPVVYQLMEEAIELRLKLDIPQTQNGWFILLAKVVSLSLFMGIILLVVKSFIFSSDKSLQRGFNRLVKRSWIFTIIGLSLFLASFSSLTVSYQLILLLGTLLFGFSQYEFLWHLQYFFEENPPKHNPFIFFLPLIILGLFILYLDVQGLLLVIVWSLLLIITILATIRKCKVLKYNNITKYIPYFAIYIVLLTVMLFLTFLGWGRLSILLTTSYAAIVLAIQGIIAILNFANKVQKYFPEDGYKAILYAVALAIGVPIAFLLFFISFIVWLWAYPGSSYITQNILMMNLHIGKYSFSFAQIVSVLSVVYITRSLIVVGRSFLSQLKMHEIRIKPALIGPLQITYTYVLWAICGLYILNAVGFDLSNLAVIAGGLSVGIGFGLQNIIQNFTSGLVIIFGQVIREGDLVEVASYTGIVKKVHIRSTVLETFENATIFIPNSQFLTDTFTNWTHNGSRVRREIIIGVAYGTDMDLAIELLYDIAERNTSVLKYPKPVVLFTDFGNSTLNLVFRIWIGNVSDSMSILSALRLEIDKVYKQNSINIAFPQMDIHIKTQDSQLITPTKSEQIRATSDNQQTTV